jgi:Tfp pilus assembly PilM family ATPase
MPRTVTGIDVNTAAAVFLRGHVKGNTFAATGYGHQYLDATDANEAWDALEVPFAPKLARVGVTGREVNVKYVRVPRLPDWQLRKLMRFEVEEVGGASESSVAADFNVLPPLPEVEDEDVVLLAMARESLLETLLENTQSIGGQLDAFTPNSVALYNVWVRFGVVMDDTVMIANIGGDDVDVVIVRGSDLVFARNLSGGSRLFDRAIADRLGIDLARASKVRRQLVDLAPGATFTDQAAERASRACAAPAGQIASLLQSSVTFAKSQVRVSSLRLDRVFVCGDLADTAGLAEQLTGSLGVKTEVFDPFTVVDTGKLDQDAAELLEQHKSASVVALGLATAASDPNGYGVEILPKAVLAKRDFQQGTLFLVLAAVLAVGFLGWRFADEKSRAASAETRANGLTSQLNQKKRDDAATEELLLENTKLAELARELRAVAGTGRQLATVLDALDGLQPRGFAIKKLDTRLSIDQEFGIAKGSEAPIVVIEGTAEEGVEPNNQVFLRFVERLRGELPGYSVREGMGATNTTFSLDVTAFAAKPAVAETADAEPNDTDESNSASGR